ncbi:MAG: ATP-binding protein [Gaiella sp.]|nr:ATP-binding protein [Gaiella sp.]
MAIVESARTGALLERENLLAALEAALGGAGAGDGALLLVGGEAGIGKTALARRFVDEVDREATRLWGRCDPLVTPPPLGPFLEVAAAAPPVVSEAIRADAGAHAVAAALLAAGEQDPPLLLVLEDVHWADEATLDVLRVLGRRVAGTPDARRRDVPRRRARARASSAGPARRPRHGRRRAPPAGRAADGSRGWRCWPTGAPSTRPPSTG